MIQLPEKVNPFELASQAAVFNGSIEKARLQRLCELLTSPQGEVQVLLKFGLDEMGKVYFTVGIEAQLELVCQRCGEPVSCDINVEPKIRPVSTDTEAIAVQKTHDAWVTHGKPISVIELVEEELLLSLPAVAKHEQGDCPVELQRIFS